MLRDTFQYEGKYFSFTVTMETKGRNNTKEEEVSTISLNTENIIEFWYENKINSLNQNAYITYLDTDATIDKVSSYQYVLVQVTIARRDIKTSGATKIEHEVEGEKITLNFWLDNIEIKNSKPQEIMYNLRLISKNSINLSRITQYSSYGSQELVTTSIHNLLSKGGVSVDSKSFETNASKVILPYISNGTDTLYDSIRYLQYRQFYKKDRDDTINMISYNDRINSYCMFGFKKNTDWQTTRPFKISMVKNKGDIYSMEENTNIAFVCNKKNIEMYKTQFPKKLYDYSIETNEFEQVELLPSEIIKLLKDDQNNSNRVDIEENSELYTTTQSFWNNNQNIYLEQIDNIIENTGLKINVGGCVGIVPGDSIGIDFSYDGQLSEKNDKIKREYSEKFKSFNGGWFVSRIVYRVFPKDCKFRQIISLMRIKDQDTLKSS